jgi:hypothetical protein
MVALFAAVGWMSVWLPWLTKRGGGWANAVGGHVGNLPLQHHFGAGQLIVLLSSALLVTGAMVGRGLSVRPASVIALIISVLEIALMARYYAVNVKPPVSAAYGLYVGGAAVAAGLLCSLWALATSLRR